MHMETKKHLRRIPAIAAALAVGCTLPFLLGNANLPQDNADEAARHSLVQTPELPAQVSFAGQAVALDRYDLRERFDRELTAFCYLHSTTLLILKRANRYFPVVEPILRENGIPDDFKYLMAIESNLDLQARSPRGAAGPWQFMEATGRQFGLEVNRNIDERYHLEKATRAACKYLRQAYGKYHDWVSVAASYNAGQHRISTSLANQGEDTALDLWLNSETSRYMFRILALKTVFTHPARYGFRLRAENLYPPVPIPRHHVPGGHPRPRGLRQGAGRELLPAEGCQPLAARHAPGEQERTHLHGEDTAPRIRVVRPRPHPGA